MPNALTMGTPASAGAAKQAAPAPPQNQLHIDDAKKITHKQVMIDRALQDLLKKEGGLKRADVIDMAVSLVADQVLSPQAMAGYLSDLPEEPQKIRTWAEAHAATVESNLDKMMEMLDGAFAPQEAVQ